MYEHTRYGENICVGISVTKDLACIAAVKVEPSQLKSMTFDEFGQAVYYSEGEEISMVSTAGCPSPDNLWLFTYADGRAFKSVPYFNRWKPELTLHDNNLEGVEFGRALGDLCDKWGTQVIGYDPEQTKILSRYAVAVDKDSLCAHEALHILNKQVTGAGCSPFSEHSVCEYMWNSLPTKQVVNDIGGLKYEVTERVFPTSDLVASGRYDIVRAVTNAIAVGLMVNRNDVPWREAEKEASDRFREQCISERRTEEQVAKEKIRQIEEYWENLPPNAQVFIRLLLPNPRVLPNIMSMSEALPLLKSRSAEFVRMGYGWESYAWRGFRSK
jgi:hypothetical protein